METLKIGLGEIVAGIPTVLGHEPSEAVVALSLNESGLPTCAFEIPRSVLLDEDSAGVTAAAVAEELCEDRGFAVLLVSYTDADVRAHCPALEALRLEVDLAVPNAEVLAVKDGEWFRPGCFDAGCCPRDLPEVPVAYANIVEDARRRAEEHSERARRALERVQRRFEHRESAAMAWEEALADGAVCDATTARRLAATLDDLCVRDWVVLTILGAGSDARDDALEGLETGAVAVALDAALVGHARPNLLVTERARAVVERVARAARGRSRKAATNTLVAVLDWWEGNLDEAKERCDVALSADPNYRLAELVLLAVSRGIRPGWLAHAGQSAH
jgi:hypothetical protein